MRLHAALAALTLTAVFWTVPANADGAGVGQVMLRLSFGQGVTIRPLGGAGDAGAAASPFTTELVLGVGVCDCLSIDLGLLFAYDLLQAGGGAASSRAHYTGMRPGIHFFPNPRRSRWKPYFRAAIPIVYNLALGQTQTGLLLGGGIEYRLCKLAFFAEASVTPTFNVGNVIPIEARFGAALHF